MGIIFANKQHKDFYLEYLPKCRYNDAYHRALVYCLGINRDTREHVNQIYDFQSGLIKTECLHDGWQTSGSKKIVRLAFNLYTNGMPSIYDCDGAEQQVKECQRYTVGNLFCCSYAVYFVEAVKIRYEEYF